MAGKKNKHALRSEKDDKSSHKYPMNKALVNVVLRGSGRSQVPGKKSPTGLAEGKGHSAVWETKKHSGTWAQQTHSLAHLWRFCQAEGQLVCKSIHVCDGVTRGSGQLLTWIRRESFGNFGSSHEPSLRNPQGATCYGYFYEVGTSIDFFINLKNYIYKKKNPFAF